MHELLLLAAKPIPPTAVDLTLSVLAGLAAAQPTPYTALHLVFAPTRAPASFAAATRSALPNQHLAAHPRIAGVAGDLFYIQLVGRLHERAGRRRWEAASDDAATEPAAASTAAAAAAGVVDVTQHPWTLEFRDFPEAGKDRPVTSRLMASIPLAGGDPVAFVRAMGYEFLSAHFHHGHQVVHNAVQVLLTQLLPLKPNDGSPPGQLPATVPDPTTLVPLDPSGARLLQATVRVADGAQPELLAQGAAELTALKTSLKGVVDLEPGDRMALDTRVKA